MKSDIVTSRQRDFSDPEAEKQKRAKAVTISPVSSAVSFIERPTARLQLSTRFGSSLQYVIPKEKSQWVMPPPKIVFAVAPPKKEDFGEKLDAIQMALKGLEEDHKQIYEGITLLHGTMLSCAMLLENALFKYPHQVLKLIFFFIGAFSIFGLLLGKILNRIIIAPDFGLVLIIMSITLYGTTHLSLRNLNRKIK